MVECRGTMHFGFCFGIYMLIVYLLDGILPLIDSEVLRIYWCLIHGNDSHQVSTLGRLQFLQAIEELYSVGIVFEMSARRFRLRRQESREEFDRFV